MIISLTLLKFLSSLSILLLAWIIGIWVIIGHTLPSKSLSVNYTEGFVNGIFLGTALFHLLPSAQHALQTLEGQNHYPLIYLLAASSCMLLFILERYADPLKRIVAFNTSQLFIYFLITLFSIHSLSAGIALGLSSSVSNTWILLTAILAHKGCEAYALTVHIAQQIKSRTHQFILLTTFACMTPLGIILAMVTRMHISTRHAMWAETYFNAIAAGTFLYIATLHSTVGQWRQGLRAMPLLPLLAGMSTMALVAVWA